MSVVVVRGLPELMNYVPDWESLAEQALEPNVFYEPWFLVPAVEAFASARNLEFILIFAPNPARRLGPPLLCGFFPLERRRRYKGFPVSVLSLWKHIHCYLCTPLLRTEYAHECLAAFFDWLAAGTHGCPLMEFGSINGDGEFRRLLVDCCNEASKLTYVTECFTRALLRPGTDGEQYLRTVLSSKDRRELKRRETRLAESGRFEYVALGADTNVKSWIEEFLQLEASGWKGQEGSALACNEADRTFFVAAAMEAFHRGRLVMLGVRLNGQAIALTCNFLARPGAFNFKIAFDEHYARFSPGVLLEIENIRWLHSQRGICWVDSCTASDSLIYNRLWMHRRMIPTVLVGTGRRPGDLLISLFPLLRWLNRGLSHRKPNS